MFGFSRKTDLALVLMAALARAVREGASDAAQGGAYVSLRDLARDYHLPYRFASEVIGQLARAGLVEAKEGAGGGYRLARPARETTVGQVIAATEGGIALAGCLNPATHGRCPQKTWCVAKEGVGTLQRRLLESMTRTTIADMLKEHAG